ncbi:MAG TPA: ATPase, T2SS/T4P/T4SS family, partial [Gemmatimonadaceae bacterium]|nr:ATPase, T2SS/T4P/T4SS family [Gemmatimonadaceae bacterium]
MASPMRAAAATAAAPAAAQSATSGFNFKSVLQELIQRNASDLHLKVGRPPTLRVNGELDPLGRPPLRPEDLKALAEQLMTPRQVKQFAEEKECDFAIGVPGIGRFRVNVYQQRGSLCYAMRAIPYQARTIAELNLPPVLEEIAMKPRGLVLVTGITGSGKSTALAGMIQHVNEHRRANIITIEDPIEFLHRDINCHINQREVGTDTANFAQALRRVLRQDPDV